MKKAGCTCDGNTDSCMRIPGLCGIPGLERIALRIDAFYSPMDSSGLDLPTNQPPGTCQAYLFVAEHTGLGRPVFIGHSNWTVSSVLLAKLTTSTSGMTSDPISYSSSCCAY